MLLQSIFYLVLFKISLCYTLAEISHFDGCFMSANQRDALPKAGKSIVFNTTDAIVDAVIERVGKEIVLAAPLGLGKSVELMNAFYQRAASDSSISLHIVTALSLEKPVPKSPVEARLLNPIVERLFGNYPGFDYMRGIRAKNLPDNISVSEFYFKAGSMKGVDYAQQNYISSNYTHVARDLVNTGVNVVVQMVAAPESISAGESGLFDRAQNYAEQGEGLLSLSCNPDVTLDLIPMLDNRKANEGVEFCTIGHIHPDLPYMYHDAEVPNGYFDLVLASDDIHSTLFAPPNGSVPDADYLAGLYASTLIADGGTLQVGIGSLSDAITYSSILRHRDNAQYQTILNQLPGMANLADSLQQVGGKLAFEKGLYVSSEMLVNGFMHLYKTGIIKRKVYDDLNLQRLINHGYFAGALDQGEDQGITLEDIIALKQTGAISATLTEHDIQYLKHWGILTQGVAANTQLTPDVIQQWITDGIVGKTLRHGRSMHGGFFLGPKDFYQSLRDLTAEDHAQIEMSSVGRINQLAYDYPLYSEQRKKARFINTGMMVTLSGAVVSDGLANNTVISGVGGQYNFVAMAHELADARSVICIRSSRGEGKDRKSNIIFNYAHTTIPRHLRDIVVTEYGIADLRSKTDQQVMIELIQIADSSFQADLIKQAIDAGKLAADFELDNAYTNNTPERIAELLAPYKAQDMFPLFPLGTDLTHEEIALASSLKEIRAMMDEPISLLKGLFKSVINQVDEEAAKPYLERLGLEYPETTKEHLLQELLLIELEEGGFLKSL